MTTDRSTMWMHRALAEAELGRGSVEPNPMVGAVVVRDGEIIAVGHHKRFGGPHAEVVALAEAGARARGATLFVTLEPCCHFGKTPPCTRSILDAGISRIVVAMRDPYPRVDGGGVRELREAGLDVEVGLMRQDAERLNAPYLKRLATGHPFVTAKWAMTLDGRMATASGSSQWISGERSRALVHETRGRMDAVIVGVQTVLSDNPMLTARPPGPRVATRVVLDSSARTPTDSRLMATARQFPTMIFVSQNAPEDRVKRLETFGARVVRFEADGPVPIRLLLSHLGEQGMTNVLVEGGARVLGSFLDAGAVDSVQVFIAPILEGGDPCHVPMMGRGVPRMDLAPRLQRTFVRVIEDDVYLEGDLPHPWLNDGPG